MNLFPTKRFLLGVLGGLAIGTVTLLVSYSPIVYTSNIDPSGIFLFSAIILLALAGYVPFFKKQIAFAVGLVLGLLLSGAAFGILLWGA